MQYSACLNPIQVWNKYTKSYVSVPCRKCDACRATAKLGHVSRLQETRLHWQDCIFFTLTYIHISLPDEIRICTEYSGTYDTAVRYFGNHDSGGKETTSSVLAYLACPVKPASHRLHGKGLTGQVRYADGLSSGFKEVSARPVGRFPLNRIVGFIKPEYPCTQCNFP